MRDLSKPMQEELERFFIATDELEAKKLEIIGWKGPKVALKARSAQGTKEIVQTDTDLGGHDRDPRPVVIGHPCWQDDHDSSLAAEFPTLSTMFCNRSRVISRCFVQYLTTASFSIEILLRSGAARFVLGFTMTSSNGEVTRKLSRYSGVRSTTDKTAIATKARRSIRL